MSYGEHLYQNLLKAVGGEIQRASKKFPAWPRDPIHAAAIIAEEMGELQQAALDYTYRRIGTKERLFKEAVQLTAMGLRFLMNLERLEVADDRECPNCDGKGQLYFPSGAKLEKRTRHRPDHLVECALCRGVGRVPR